ncbi:MAG: hypothetical protein JRJ83_18035 [Deltaproteobacteria bacterium]|nr:hypothetical protein [Deltaproteobacteria bacterium]
MTSVKERCLIAGLAAAGLSGAAWGMWAESHPPFLGGLACVVAAYVLIRRKLKASLHEKTENNSHPIRIRRPPESS